MPIQSFMPTRLVPPVEDRKSTRLNCSHVAISYAVFCLKKKKTAYAVRPKAEAHGTAHCTWTEIEHGDSCPQTFTLLAMAWRIVDVVDLLVFFFNDTATTEIYTLSLHDALPI